MFWEAVKRIIDFRTDELKEDRKQKKTKRRELALDVIKILNEATTKNFVKPPNDMNHINYIMRLLQFEDDEIGKKFTEFISAWNSCVELNRGLYVGGFTLGGHHPKTAQWREEEKYLAERKKEAENLDTNITILLKKLRG